MDKYIMVSFHGNNEVAVVNANNIQDAMMEFIMYFGIPYPLDEKDIKNLVKDFTADKFIEWFNVRYGHTVYGIYKVDKTILEKVGGKNE